MKKVKIKIDLLDHQMQFVKETAQYPALVGGFGCGKTESAIFRCLDHMFKYGPYFKSIGEEYVYGLYEPTYDLIKMILFPRFEQILNKMGIKYVLNKSDKVLKIYKLGTIIFRSLENTDKIIGYETADCGIDELDTLKKQHAKEAFEKIIARNRLKKPNDDLNSCSITTTPEGFRFVYEKWGKAEDKSKFKIIKGKTENNIFLPASYIKDLREQYPLNLIDAYLNGEFVNLNSSTVYSNFDREEHDTSFCLADDEKITELHIGMDFNVSKMSAVIGVLKDNKVFIVDEIFGAKDTPDMINYIKRKFGNYKIFIYPDAAGNSRKSVNASTSDIKLLRDAGFIVHNNKKNPAVKDRVLSVNGLFINMQNEKRLFINCDICKILTDNLEQQVYNENGEPDKKHDNDHMLDALGYLIFAKYPIKRLNSSNVIESPI